MRLLQIIYGRCLGSMMQDNMGQLIVIVILFVGNLLVNLALLSLCVY